MKKIVRALPLLALALVVSVSSCKKKDDAQQPCNPPHAPKASNNSPVVPGDTIRLSAELIPNATYSWIGPENFSSKERNPQFQYSEKKLGIYKVVAIVGGCVSDTFYTYVTTDKVKILAVNGQNVSRNTNGGFSSYEVQEGQMLVITTSNINDGKYSWHKISNGFIKSKVDSNAQILKVPDVSMSDSGVYVVTASARGKMSYDTVRVRMIVADPQLPDSIVAIVGDASLQLKVKNVKVPANYVWSGPLGYKDSSTTGIVTRSSFKLAKTATINSVARGMGGEYTVVAKYDNHTTKTSKVKVVIRFANMPCATGDTVVVDSIRDVKYTTVSLNNQCWTTLNCKKPGTTTDTLATWSAALNFPIALQGFCPLGWHVPQDSEWQALEKAGSQQSIITALKINSSSTYWSSTEVAGFTGDAFVRKIDVANNLIVRDLVDKGKKNLVRCIKD